jgi:uncharacterized protein YndB with AHSA1/START domain
VSRNETFIAAPPERVWQILADADCYGYWVVGSQTIRGADPDFPAVGTRFYHRVGFGPFTINDHTEVLDAHPPYRLELKAKARPLGTAHVVLLLQPRGDGTHVTMIEDPGDPLTKLVFNPLTHLLVRGRNAESLRRLKELSEDPARAAAAPTG